MAATAVSIHSNNRLTQFIERLTGALKTKDGEYPVVVIEIGKGAREGLIVGVSVAAGSYFAAATTTRTLAVYILGFGTTAAVASQSSSLLYGKDQLQLSIHAGAAAVVGSKFGVQSIGPFLLGNISGGIYATSYDHETGVGIVEKRPAAVMANVYTGAVANFVSRTDTALALTTQSGASTVASLPMGSLLPTLVPVVVNEIIARTQGLPKRMPPFRNLIIATTAVAGGRVGGLVGAVAAAVFTGGLFGYFSHKSKS